MILSRCYYKSSIFLTAKIVKYFSNSRILVNFIIIAIQNQQVWLSWQHDGLQTQRSNFKPCPGQTCMNKFSEKLDKYKARPNGG